MLVRLVQAVQQAPTALPLPEWERALISAAVGAFFAIIGNIAMEFVRPYLMKRTIAHQLWVEFEDTQYKTLSAASGVAYMGTRHLSRS
jgi:hypothetical protein